MSKDSIIIILLIAIAAFAYFTIWSEHPAITDVREQQVDSLQNQLQVNDSLLLIQDFKTDSLEKINLQLVLQRDSLAQVKNQLILKYHEIYINLNSSSNTQLDSIIRANWW